MFLKSIKKFSIITLLFQLIVLSLRGQKLENRPVIDIEGNVYKTAVIGKYLWMAENLKTTKFNNGKEIRFVTGSSNWSVLNDAAYCWYDDDKANSVIYGALYNFFAVNTGKLCPEGWRVPSDEEWKYLEGYVDSLYKIDDQIWDESRIRGYNAGRRLKAKSGWKLGGNGTDEFGFSALPGGERLTSFNNSKGGTGFWWTSTEFDQSSAWYRCIIYSLPEMSRGPHPKRMGFSVRCLKDK
jgi:uncharacterized protein (TIGR02145 family)